MPIHVKSEIGPLKRVLLHRPGNELEHLVPDALERLLFDDIPYLRAAQHEHDIFAGILREHGVEVLYLDDLVAETIRLCPEAKERLLQDFLQQASSAAQSCREELIELLTGIQDEKKLVQKTMAGVGSMELPQKGRWPLAQLVRRQDRFIADPIPNLYFTRDPFACIGDGVSLNHMYSVTRQRETLYGGIILRYHPDYRDSVPLYYNPECPFSIEGGDILNLSSHVLAVGLSQRTTPEAIEILAQRIFADERAEIQTILAFDIPSMRAFMHLDTVFTQVDRDKFTVHPGILESLRLFEVRPGEKAGELSVRTVERPLADALKEYLHLDHVTLINCGGKDRIASEREQWNDGSNTLCIAPGKVVVYDRNYITNAILRENGITVLEMPSSELSRGRGGPRCMSMPLWREDVD